MSIKPESGINWNSEDIWILRTAGVAEWRRGIGGGVPLPAGGGSGSKDVRAGNPTLWILLCLKFLQKSVIVFGVIEEIFEKQILETKKGKKWKENWTLVSVVTDH